MDGRSWTGNRLVTVYDKVGRNGEPNGFFIFDAETGVPDGVYRARVEVLKALGDPNNPNHIEVRYTEPFTIRRR